MHTVICTPYSMAALFNNHPYISSSGMPIGTKFSSYLCKDAWLLNNVAMLIMECISLCAWHLHLFVYFVSQCMH